MGRCISRDETKSSYGQGPRAKKIFLIGISRLNFYFLPTFLFFIFWNWAAPLKSVTVHWDMNFIRLVHDSEVDVVSSLFNVMYSVSLVQGVEDKLCWILSKRRSFEVKTFYKALISYAHSYFHWRKIWRSKAHLMVALFTWTTSLEKKF